MRPRSCHLPRAAHRPQPRRSGRADLRPVITGRCARRCSRFLTFRTLTPLAYALTVCGGHRHDHDHTITPAVSTKLVAAVEAPACGSLANRGGRQPLTVGLRCSSLPNLTKRRRAPAAPPSASVFTVSRPHHLGKGPQLVTASAYARRVASAPFIEELPERKPRPRCHCPGPGHPGQAVLKTAARTPPRGPCGPTSTQRGAARPLLILNVRRAPCPPVAKNRRPIEIDTWATGPTGSTTHRPIRLHGPPSIPPLLPLIRGRGRQDGKM